ncbi:MAG: PCP reductase family protein [Anaerolineales bacterium]|nr:PCP reductase family protein [Anaerolineales bacterium]
MKTMSWDDELWRKLKDAISPMPPFIRKKALKMIIEASEDFAQERGAEIVEEEDLVRAAREKVPDLVRQSVMDALAEQGIRVNGLT